MNHRTCIVHIGTHKTGTSALQKTLTAGDFCKAGYFFPTKGRLTNDGGHHAAAMEMYKPNYPTGHITALLEELSISSLNAIISSEEFTSAIFYNPGIFTSFLESLGQIFDDIIIICYIRRQEKFLQSNYIQRLKSKFSFTFKDYVFSRLNQNLEEYPLDYTWLTERLEKLEKLAEIRLRSYDGLTKSVIRDFEEVLHLPAAFSMADIRVNETTCLVDAMKKFVAAQLDRKLSQSEEIVLDLIGYPISAMHPQMHSSNQMMLRNHFSRSNKKIAEKWNLPGLVDTPPLSEDNLSLEDVFSRLLPTIVPVLADRMQKEFDAREEAQKLAWERLDIISALEKKCSSS
ncbi:Hypothetical protein GbCGDNIH3_7255 [Granulibacter bethesdensis]|uniref:Uncharacterized protein n=1 Tax=Granulibacter bethesdensis TaxID=364410 RepID=A0AAN0RF50_9PROT|nr:hypothetical protein [Granulibacter bethesdensis]AHJ63641.1 Hypothetical protein GbCGDNIH3_7255 [Granulibacter bethesdensis]